MKNKSEVSSWMIELSEYMAGAHKRTLPSDVIERAKLHILDTVSAIISGSRLPPGRQAIAHVKSLGGAKEAGVMGTRFVTNAINAALANGMCAHADETDDVHVPTRCHPGANVVPAAIAVSERQQSSGVDLLRAVVLGYDICTRMIYALGIKEFFHSGHNVSCFGGLFGATAAAASLFRLNAKRTRFALSYAAQHAAGMSTMLRDSEHIEKAYALGGMPTSHAVTSALLVKNGCSGVEDVFTGEPNFLRIFSKASEGSALVNNLGEDYQVMHTRIKRWPTGGPTQGPLQVLSELMQEHGFRAKDVQKLMVRSPDSNLMVVDDRDMPSISLQYLLAIMLIDGKLSFAATHSRARMEAATVLDMRRRIGAVGDPNMAGAVRDWNCEIEVLLNNGRKLNGKTAPVDPQKGFPIARRDVQEKAVSLMGPILGAKGSAALCEKLLTIDKIDDVKAIRRLYSI